jgi:hypothetical protein
MKQFFQILIITSLVSAGCSLMAQQTNDDLLHQVRVDVAYLSSDLLQGRETGTEGELLAAEYIARRLESIGIQPKGGKDQWFQEFDFSFSSNPHGLSKDVKQGMNVVGYIDNGASTTVVIGAHYDHLGYGHFGSRHVGDPAIHNGADDNASGVAALLTLAEKLKNSSLKNNNYLFLAFSGEEMGLFGSKHFVDDPSIDLSGVNYMLNMDMIGRLNEEGVLVVNGAGTSPVWKPALEKIKVGDIKVKTTDSGVGPSDHTSFYFHDIPVLHFFTGQHTDYHKPEDDSHLVNYEGILEISDFIYELMTDLDDEGELAFTKTKDENEGRKAARFKVTLGVMPDYVYDGSGMRIDGVMEDRPAQKAGMEKGDIIVKMGELEVNDIYDYMEGLAAFKVGDKTTVVVKRGEELVEMDVVF